MVCKDHSAEGTKVDWKETKLDVEINLNYYLCAAEMIGTQTLVLFMELDLKNSIDWRVEHNLNKVIDYVLL